eukprot:4894935-Ditylum_brightwellii.AAC.1
MGFEDHEEWHYQQSMDAYDAAEERRRFNPDKRPHPTTNESWSALCNDSQWKSMPSDEDEILFYGDIIDYDPSKIVPKQ